MITPMQIVKAVNDFTETMKEADFVIYQATVAMLLEERCLTKGLDMVQACKDLYKVAVDVNNECGKYGGQIYEVHGMGSSLDD